MEKNNIKAPIESILATCDHCGTQNVEILGNCAYEQCKNTCCTNCGKIRKDKVIHKEGKCKNEFHLYNRNRK